MKKMHVAAKSMIQLLFYVVLLIGMWIVIGLLAFPKTSSLERITSFVQQNENVLVQVAENAMDETVNPGIMNSIEVLKILGNADISAVIHRENGASFVIDGDDTPAEPGYLHLIYLPDGQYAFSAEGEWSAATPDKTGALRWENAAGETVTVARLTDHFFLEEAHLK